MKRWRAAGLVLCGGILGARAPDAVAHHSYTSWAPTYMTITGTVKDYEYTSPHIWIQVMTLNSDGNQVQWGLETGSPASMKNAGWTPNLLQTGDKVTAIVHPKRDGTNAGSILELDLPGGKVLKVRDLTLILPGGAGPCGAAAPGAAPGAAPPPGAPPNCTRPGSAEPPPQ